MSATRLLVLGAGRGDFTGTAWWGLGVTVALVVLGMWFGARTFRRESA